MNQEKSNAKNAKVRGKRKTTSSGEAEVKAVTQDFNSKQNISQDIKAPLISKKKSSSKSKENTDEDKNLTEGLANVKTNQKKISSKRGTKSKGLISKQKVFPVQDILNFDAPNKEANTGNFEVITEIKTDKPKNKNKKKADNGVVANIGGENTANTDVKTPDKTPPIKMVKPLKGSDAESGRKAAPLSKPILEAKKKTGVKNKKLKNDANIKEDNFNAANFDKINASDAQTQIAEQTPHRKIIAPPKGFEADSPQTNANLVISNLDKSAIKTPNIKHDKKSNIISGAKLNDDNKAIVDLDNDKAIRTEDITTEQTPTRKIIAPPKGFELDEKQEDAPAISSPAPIIAKKFDKTSKQKKGKSKKEKNTAAVNIEANTVLNIEDTHTDPIPVKKIIAPPKGYEIKIQQKDETVSEQNEIISEITRDDNNIKKAEKKKEERDSAVNIEDGNPATLDLTTSAQSLPRKVINPPKGFEVQIVQNNKTAAESIESERETLININGNVVKGQKNKDKNINSKDINAIAAARVSAATIEKDQPRKVIVPPKGFDAEIREDNESLPVIASKEAAIKLDGKSDGKSKVKKSKKKKNKNNILAVNADNIAPAAEAKTKEFDKSLKTGAHSKEVDLIGAPKLQFDDSPTAENLTAFSVVHNSIATDDSNQKKNIAHPNDELYQLLNELDAKRNELKLDIRPKTTNEQHEGKRSRRNKKKQEKPRLTEDRHSAQRIAQNPASQFPEDNGAGIPQIILEHHIENKRNPQLKNTEPPKVSKQNDADLNASKKKTQKHKNVKNKTSDERIISTKNILPKKTQDADNIAAEAENTADKAKIITAIEKPRRAQPPAASKVEINNGSASLNNERQLKKRNQQKVYNTHRNKRLPAMPDSLAHTIAVVEKFISSTLFIPDEASLLLGVSGGVDSVVMLDIMAALAQKHGYQLFVAHCNHGLRGEASDADEKFARSIAANYRAPFRSAKFDAAQYAKITRTSIENAARTLRYQFFEQVAKSAGSRFVLSAHTADDTAETLLLNLLRGAGLTGLAGIPPRRPLAKKIHLVRPLLQLSKQQLIDYAQNRPLEWREDKSNASMLFMRNKIRHKLLPLLRDEYTPAISEILVRTTRILQGAEAVVSDRVEHLVSVMTTQDAGAYRLGLSFFDTIGEFLQGEMIQQIIRNLGGRPASMATVDRIIGLKNSEVNAECRVSGQITAIRDRNDIIFTTNNAPDIYEQIAVGGSYIFKDASLRLTECKSSEIHYSEDGKTEYFDAGLLPKQLTLRVWRQGDIFRPLGLGGSMKISDFLTNIKVSVTERKRALVLCAGNEIVWVCGRRISDTFKITKSTKNAIRAEFAFHSEKTIENTGENDKRPD